MLVVGRGPIATTDREGRYEIRNLRPGTYEVLARLEHLATVRQRVTVGPDQPAELHFALARVPIREQVP